MSFHGEKTFRGLMVCAIGAVALGGTAAKANVTLNFESLCHTRSIVSVMNTYEEGGYRLHSSAFANWGMYHRNAAGTSALFAVLDNDLITFSAADGSAFNLQSIDLSEAFRTGGYVPVTFVGHRADGTSVTDSVVLDGAFGFETHRFQGFDNLTSVSWRQNEAYHQFDNITVLASRGAGAVPVPGSVMLGALGIGLVTFARRRRTG